MIEAVGDHVDNSVELIMRMMRSCGGRGQESHLWHFERRGGLCLGSGTGRVRLGLGSCERGGRVHRWAPPKAPASAPKLLAASAPPKVAQVSEVEGGPVNEWGLWCTLCALYAIAAALQRGWNRSRDPNIMAAMREGERRRKAL